MLTQADICILPSALPGASARAGRTLQQAATYNTFPGCTFFADSPVLTNPQFSTLVAGLKTSGLTREHQGSPAAACQAAQPARPCCPAELLAAAEACGMHLQSPTPAPANQDLLPRAAAGC